MLKFRGCPPSIAETVVHLAEAKPDAPDIAYRPGIDGLRAIAVGSVFLYHLNRHWLPGGFVGVDVFFVISGFLITSVIQRDLDRQRFSFGRFYQRRIARLLAAFVAMSAVTLVGAFFVYSDQDLASTGATLTAAAASVANLKALMQGNYFTLSPDAQPFLHCWSLSVEEQFYLLFPGALLLVHRRLFNYRLQVFAAAFVASLALCVGLSYWRPEWAFYLLPTRAWELLLGGLIALAGLHRARSGALMQVSGVLLIAGSVLLISDASRFPGYLALLPAAGAACLLVGGNNSDTFVERALAQRPFVWLGRLSYSLYLWHWPVFALVDYRFFMAPPAVRLTLKVVLSIGAATACFLAIEQPARVFFNAPARRRLAFGFLACSLAVMLPLGTWVRSVNYINAEQSDVASGGLLFNRSATGGTMILMGDSNGSMYGKMAKSLAADLGLRLRVLSVAAGDPLPRSSGEQPRLWTDSLALVQQERPDLLLYVCLWTKVTSDPARLAIAVDQLRQAARHVVLITQPPQLPASATRDAVRNGARPPFFEDVAERAARLRVNQYLRSFRGDTIDVVDIEELFTEGSGAIRFLDDKGRQLFQDRTHVSAVGANMVMPRIVDTTRLR